MCRIRRQPDRAYLENRETSVPMYDFTCPRLMFEKNPVTGRYKVFTWYCKRVICQKCAKRKTRRYVHAILDYIEVERPCHHIILTLKRMNGPLLSEMKRLNACFTTLKKRVVWRRNIVGGVKFVHVDWNDESQVWGPHLHLIVEAGSMPTQDLSRAWDSITGGSWVVHDRRIDMEDVADREDSVAYAAGSPYLKWGHNAPVLQEFERLTKGRRFTAVLGAWYGKVRLAPNRRGDPSLL